MADTPTPGTARATQHPPQDAVHFQTSAETHHLLPEDLGQGAALLVNPQASASVLLAAAETRVCHLLLCLNGWAEAASSNEATPSRIVGPSLDLAEQVQQLLQAVRARGFDRGIGA